MYDDNGLGRFRSREFIAGTRASGKSATRIVVSGMAAGDTFLLLYVHTRTVDYIVERACDGGQKSCDRT